MTDLHPGIAPLAFLLGTWRGSGRGVYPTIDDFAYDEEVTIGHMGKPFLRYEQRTKRAGTGEPLHTEVGYWRASGDGAELVIAQPTGVTEVLAGPIDGTSVAVTSVQVGLAPTAKEVVTTERRVTVDGDTMRYTLLMGAVGQEHQVHLEATLTRATR
jgi:hypothetical protein